MSLDFTTFPFTGGMSKAVASGSADPGLFYDLVNMRQSASQKGNIEQTPRFALNRQYSVGTYYQAGSHTESTSSQVRLLFQNAVMTDHSIHTFANTQVQVFYQTTQPTAETIYTGCRLVIENVTSLAITLGNTLDVVIEAGGLTFKYRKNGGAYVTAVPITTTGVSIDAGNATLYFLASAGFTATDTWSWTRTDDAISGSTAFNDVLYNEYHGTECFYTTRDMRVMRLTADSAASTVYAISVGYRAVYGRTLTVFFEHLIVGGYSKTAPASVTPFPSRMTVGNSDVTDLDDFIATDVNEADSKLLITQAVNNSGVAITSVKSLNSVLYVFTSDEFFQTSYLGLAGGVFSYQRVSTLYCIYAISAKFGLYVVAQDAIYFFDGSSLTAISDPVSRDFVYTLTTTESINFGLSTIAPCYDAYDRELHILNTLTLKVYTYQEKDGYKCWHSRAVDFDGAAPTALVSMSGQLFFGIQSRKVVYEDVAWGLTPLMDSTAGAAFTTPKITFQLISKPTAIVKEVTTAYLVALVSTRPSSALYSTAAFLSVDVYWYTPTTGIISGNPSTDTASTWNNGMSSQQIDVRTSFRQIAFELQLRGTDGSKPPGLINITGFEPELKNNEKRKVEK